MLTDKTLGHKMHTLARPLEMPKNHAATVNMANDTIPASLASTMARIKGNGTSGIVEQVLKCHYYWPYNTVGNYNPDTGC
jgi:hypothetical protein